MRHLRQNKKRNSRTVCRQALHGQAVHSQSPCGTALCDRPSCRRALCTRTLRRLALCCLAVCVLLLGGCTAQSTPLGRRAMVRLVYLDTVDGGWRALCVVCDFAPTVDAEQETGAAVVTSGTGTTPEAALYAAASARGGQPFFAQNSLLLLGAGVQGARLMGLLEYFAADPGAYRDPAVFLWQAGAETLAGLEDPMAFVQLVEQLVEEDAQGCVCRVLQTDPADAATVLPLLNMQTAADQKTPLASLEGLAVYTPDSCRVYHSQRLLQGYGLLRGTAKQLLVPVQLGGHRYTVQLEGLGRSLTARDGQLWLTVRGNGVTPAAEPLTPGHPLTAALNAALRAEVTDAWQTLTIDGQLDILRLDWWAQQLGLPPDTDPAFAAEIQLH